MTARRLIVSYRYAGTDAKLISGLSPRVRSIYNLSLQVCSVPCPFAEVETTPRRKAGRSRTVDSLPPLSSMEDLTIQHSPSQSIPCRLQDRNRPEISEEWMTTLLPSHNHRWFALRVLLRAGLDSASLLSTSSKDAPSGTNSLRNTPVLPIVSLRVKTLIRSLTMSELTLSNRATSDSLPTIGDSMCPSSVG